ncbi:MAG: hypothetical protein EU550_01250 [Promethearchaeota archaeon]|nr:MAG: hypothetical protein EU550_01250 [Candidatus Lokiarchaeota archaeon]
MCPIITHEDELELANTEKDLVSHMKKLAKAQNSLIKTQEKYAEALRKSNIEREMLNRTFRDVLKQMQTLVREKRSNIQDEEVNLFQDIIHKNDMYIEVNNKYIDAIKNLTLKKEYFVKKKEELANALDEVAGKRGALIKKALNVEKAKNKLIEGEKLKNLDSELNDYQREFDRARDVLIKKIHQFIEVRDELNELWIQLKNSVSKSS